MTPHLAIPGLNGAPRRQPGGPPTMPGGLRGPLCAHVCVPGDGGPRPTRRRHYGSPQMDVSILDLPRTRQGSAARGVQNEHDLAPVIGSGTTFNVAAALQLAPPAAPDRLAVCRLPGLAPVKHNGAHAFHLCDARPPGRGH